jgi:stearoyl-CoA desaturase (Delta-9 desaturase)
VNPSKRSDKIVVNRYLKVFRMIHVLSITILPAVGTVWAVLDLRYHPLSLINMGLLTGMFALTAVGIEVGYHRFFSHRSFQATTGVTAVLVILGSMAAQGPVIYWVGLHRRHHEYSDKPNDPHSPNLHGKTLSRRIQGLWHSHLGWMFDHEVPNPVYYSPEILRNTTLSKLNRLYFVWVMLGLIVPTALGGVLSGTWYGAWSGFLWGGAVRLFFGEHLIWTINSVVHVFGSRPFKTADGSRNLFWLAIPTIGGSWHNNHHAFPNSAITGLQWWQLDLGGCLIRVLEFFGLVWDVKNPTPCMIEARLKVTPNA